MALFDRELDEFVTVEDPSTVVEVQGTALLFTVTTEESVSAADSQFTEVDYHVILSDSSSITDGYLLIETVFPEDSVSITDGYLLVETSFPEDSVSIGDTLLPETNYVRTTATDVLGIVEERLAETDYVRSGSDIVSVSDELVVEGFYGVNDNVSVTDQLLAETNYVREVSDTISVTDVCTSEPNPAGDDSVSVTDQLSIEASYVRPVEDTLDVTDLILTELYATVQLSDTIAITDQILTETAFPQDAVSVTDQTVANVFFERQGQDSSSVTDAAFTDAVYERSLSDSISETDTVTAIKEVFYDVQPSDTLSVTDQTIAERVLELNDTISVTDQLLASTQYVRDSNDTVAVSDTVDRTASYGRAVNDTLSVTDSATSEITKGRSVSDTISATDQVVRDTHSHRIGNDSVAATDTVTIVFSQLFVVDLATDSIAATDFVTAESIDVDVEVSDTVFAITDTIAREVNAVKVLSDTIAVTDTVEAKKGGEVDRSANDSISATDTVSYIQDHTSVLVDTAFAVDQVLVVLETPVTMGFDSDGFGLTLELEQELRYDQIRNTDNYHFKPLLGGVPFQVQEIDPQVTLYQSGTAGQVVYQGSQNYWSNVFRISGEDASSTTTVAGNHVQTSEAVSTFDSYVVEVLGPSSTTRSNGFSGGNVNDYIEVTNGVAPGLYRIAGFTNAATVVLDRPLPVVGPENGALAWNLTSAVQGVHFRTTNKITNQANYELLIKDLTSKTGTLFETGLGFYTSGVGGPRVDDVTITEDGVVLVHYDQSMKTDRDLIHPSEYLITGPSDVMIKRAWSVDSETVALETLGLGDGSYLLQVNTSGTPKDEAGNPTDPIFSQAVFTGSVPLTTRSVFTDKGPIAKPPLTIQSGVGASIASITTVTLPGASLTANHVGMYIKLGPLGKEQTSSSSVAGTVVTVSNAVYTADTLKVELLTTDGITVVYTTLKGTYKIVGIVSSTQAKLEASFSFPDPTSGHMYWELVDPRNGEIADDPADVTVRVNGEVVTPLAVAGLLGQVVLESTPGPLDDVRVDYSWCCNPTVEFRRLNSKEFRLNSGELAAVPTSHKYKYQNVTITPSDYNPLDMRAALDQPELRELHYRAYERAYTPVLNDPSLLLLNSPIHKIAFPPAQRTVNEEFISYEATVLPDSDSWTRHGAGAASVLAGILTVIDNITGTFPTGQPLFWTHDLDLTFPHAFAMSWRFQITSVPTCDGVFTGVAAGYTDESAAYVVGFLEDSGVKKIGFLKRGSGDDPSLENSWTGGVDSFGDPTNEPTAFDWSILHSYRVFRDSVGTVRLYVDGDIVETLKISPSEAPFLEELNSPFDEIQGAFFGSLSRPAANQSEWDFVRYLVLPTNPLQTSPSSFVAYEATVVPEIDSKPWTQIGFHGTETILSGSHLLLDSTSATDASTASQVGLMGGDFRGFVRMEPLLAESSQVVVDLTVQLRTHTHGVDPYGLMCAVDDGQRLMQVCFFPHKSSSKISYGGRSFPEEFSPYVWSSMGGASASMVGRLLRISDANVGDGKVYFIEDQAPISSDDRVVSVSNDYILEFRNKVVSYTVDGSGFAGAFGQVYDGARALGLMFQVISGTRYVAFHSDGVDLGPSGRFAFNWFDGNPHTYRFSKSTSGNLVSLFVDGTFVGSIAYSSFTTPVPGDPVISFGSSTPASSASLSMVDWNYCNVWRIRSDQKRLVGIWKGQDPDSLTGYHLPLKTSGKGAQVVGNALGDSNANFITASVGIGDLLVVDFGDNKGVYEVAGVGSATTLTIVGTWPTNPSTVDYRIIRETDWSAQHKYRLARDSSGQVSLFYETDITPLITIGYNSLDLPASGVGIVKTLTNGLPAVAFGSFSSENLEQSTWDYVKYGITRSPTELKIAPHHQFLNQWNVMQSPERLYTAIPHELTSFQSSSTGVAPKKDPDFLKNAGLPAFTQLNEGTPLVPSTQTFEVRNPTPVLEYISVLNTPEDVLNSDGDFTLNDGTAQYRLIIPDDVLYSALDVIEQTTGEQDLIAPFGDECSPALSGLEYTKESCLVYDASTLPEEDTTAASPWYLESDTPADVSASVSSGILTYGTAGSATVYKNYTFLPDAPGLQTEARFRIRLTNDATLGTGDSQVRFGISAPGSTIGLAFITTPLAERYVVVVDLNNGNYLGAISFDFLDGAFHDYRIVRDPGSGTIRVSVDP